MFRKYVSMDRLRRMLRLAAVLTAIGLPLGLFYGGAQPVAVNLIAAPWDKLAHLAVFATLAASIGYASGLRGARRWWLAFGCALAVGVVDEWRQAWLPGRAAGWDDLAADALGSALGATALRWAVRVEQYLEAWLLGRH